jgi:DNA-binding CsgD family transcriptional regulator
MHRSLGRALGASVAAVAALNAISALSMPVSGRRVSGLLIGVWLVLLLCHAALYWFGEQLRQRSGVAAYAAAQAVALFAIAVSRVPIPVTVGIFMAATVELVLLGGARWGTTRITLATIALFVLASLITSGVYYATTAGLALAVAGVVGHAIAALTRRGPELVVASNGASPPIAPSEISTLTSRENEVLRELVRGARNSEIAATLGISERTVKSHLKSIFQKLGVESRSAAVAAAFVRGQTPS